MAKLADLVNEGVAAVALTNADQPAAGLARTYAAAIDDGGDLAKLGPALLACLDALLMSPRARAAAKKAVTHDPPVANPLDQLADRRRARSAPTVDAAAP